MSPAEEPINLREVQCKWQCAADRLLSANEKVRKLEQELSKAQAERDTWRREEHSALMQLETALKESELDATRPEEQTGGRVTRIFEPGTVGVQVSWPFVVRVVPGGQAADMGVSNGWRIHKINDEDCTEELFQKYVAGEEAYALTFQCKISAREAKRPAPLAAAPPKMLTPLPERTWSIATPRELSPCASASAEKKTVSVEEEYEDWEKGLESLSLAFTSKDRAANLKACLMKANVPRMLSLPF
mmetsp:Transcript_29494/g.53746  ORF Transcript_29494/g.53746 Transcript_29494/m.53746 type:complete len:245 (+) Transcript_29494:70-804(+)